VSRFNPHALNADELLRWHGFPFNLQTQFYRFSYSFHQGIERFSLCMTSAQFRDAGDVVSFRVAFEIITLKARGILHLTGGDGKHACWRHRQAALKVSVHISPGSEGILPSETRRGRDALAPRRVCYPRCEQLPLKDLLSLMIAAQARLQTRIMTPTFICPYFCRSSRAELARIPKSGSDCAAAASTGGKMPIAANANPTTL